METPPTGRPPKGRPPMPPDERFARVTTFLSPELSAWVSAQAQPHECKSKTISRLLQKLRDRK